MGLNKNIIEILNKFILGSIKPDFTFFFIVNKNNLKKRLSKRKRLNRYDKFNYNFYQRVQKSYLNLSKKRKHIIIDSNNKLNLNKKIIKDKLIKIIN